MRCVFSLKPPPVMCAMPLIVDLREQRQYRLDVDARRREQGFAERAPCR